MKTDKDGPAFSPKSIRSVGDPPGMTKMEYFTAQALQGFCAAHVELARLPHGSDVDKLIATLSVAVAKATIQELNKVDDGGR